MTAQPNISIREIRNGNSTAFCPEEQVLIHTLLLNCSKVLLLRGIGDTYSSIYFSGVLWGGTEQKVEVLHEL